MKKLFTLLLGTAVAVATQATDYNVPISINVNGVTSEQKGVISIVENGGLYDLTVKNFMLESSDGPMGVGNVEVKGIKPYQDGNATLLVTSQTITITPGDDPNVAFWMAQGLPPVPVELRGKLVGDHLRCYLDINLEAMNQVIKVAIGEGYQIANQSFEAWHTATNADEPNGWHSFASGTGLAAMAGNHLEKSEKSKEGDAHSGEASARLFATSIFGIIANGTMTTGRMNAGSFSATDPTNHAFLDMSSTDVDGNGDPYYTPLYAVPDEMAVWVKFKQGTPNADHPYATISAAVTDGTRYQDPEDQTYTNVVAKAKNNTIATTGDEWVKVTAPFVATGNAVEPKAVLVTISTNADAGQGSGGDEVLVDDIEFIYNANVTALKIKGQDVAGFNADKADYEMELNEEITAADIDVTVDSKTAHVMKQVVLDGEYYVCTITVINADMSTKKTYKIKVKSSATSISNVKTATKQAATYFTLDGREVKTLTPGNIYISRQADGKTTKVRY